MDPPPLPRVADPDNLERPAEGSGGGAADQDKQGGEARPDAAEEATVGGAGGCRHRLEVRPRRLLDEAVADADVGSARGGARPRRVDRRRREEVLQRGVTLRARLDRQQLEVVGRRRRRRGGGGGGGASASAAAAAVVVAVVEIELRRRDHDRRGD